MGISNPKVRANFSQFIREFIGRFAAVGNALDGMGVNLANTRSGRAMCAIRTNSDAKPNHVVNPALHAW